MEPSGLDGLETCLVNPACAFCRFCLADLEHLLLRGILGLSVGGDNGRTLKHNVYNGHKPQCDTLGTLEDHA